jgi:aldose 1-epimerase
MNIPQRITTLVLGAALAVAARAAGPVTVTQQPFGQLPGGRQATLYTLRNPDGVEVSITNYGGIVVRAVVPDRSGDLGDVVLGFDRVEGYVQAAKSNPPYFGAIIGRFANRIADGKFTLDGKTYSLPINNSPGGMPCTLHGGTDGFDKRLWHATPLIVDGQPTLRLRLVSPNGDQGFPGTLKLTVTYTLTRDNGLRIDYLATTDQATPINFTNHTYFNLRGEGDGTILREVLMIRARRITPVDAGLIPTGAIVPVAGTPFDFTTPHTIGDRINADNQQIKYGPGYDDNWVLDNQSGKLALAATVYDPSTGRTLSVYTTEPGLQFYSGNFLDGTLVGKSGRHYVRRGGFTVETQHYPDSPNHPNFPSTILRPGQTFRSTTIFQFGTR